MSICSDVFITEEEARQRVKRMLMYQQEQLIDAAIKGMETFELSMHLNGHDDLYYYNITKTKEVKNANKSGSSQT
jgi:hypothetical protein